MSIATTPTPPEKHRSDSKPAFPGRLIGMVFRHPSLDTKAKTKIILRILRNPQQIARMQQTLDELGLSFITEKHPRFLEKPARPYLSSALSMPEKVNLFCEHYKTLAHYFNTEAIEAIYTGKQPMLSSLMSGMDAEIVLHCDAAMEKEGELTISLLTHGARAYSATFVLSPRAIYIGSLQGSKSALNEIRRFTKTCHGLRPQNFLVFLIRAMAQHFGLPTIMAISNDSHIYTSKKRTQARILFDYDSFWTETGGSRLNPDYFELPLEYPRKDPADIPMNKRAMYRRRYEFFDNCAELLGQELDALRSSAKMPVTPGSP